MAKRFFKGLWDYIKRADIILWLLLAMISAYSLVLLRLKDKADAREIADSMEENISMRKWVCVEADKARVVSFDDKLLYVMADSELVDADLVADAAAKAFGATFDVDDSLVNEDESELPPELLTAPAVAD